MKRHYYIRFWGPIGQFDDVLHPVERQTYPFPTHSALRNMLGAIFWKPEMHEYGGTGYQITRLAIKNPIVTSTLTRNEVTEVIKRKMTPINVNIMRRTKPVRVDGVRTQRSSVILRDLDYVVEFYINFPDGEFNRNDGDEKLTYRGKFEEMLWKRLAVGSSFHPPYFGCREWTANFESVTEEDMIIQTPLVPNITIPLMLYEVLNLEKLSEIRPTFCPITLKDGIVTYPTWEQLKK